jgi:hypothetical protein
MDHHSLGKPGSGACEPAIGLFASRKCDNLKWKAVVSFPETNRLYLSVGENRLATPQNHQERNKILAGVRLIGTGLSIQLNA